MADAAANRALVVKALTELFVERDVSAVDRYWGDPYVQHNPFAPNGRDLLKRLVADAGPGFSCQIGMIAADGDIVMVHGRYEGIAPKPSIAVNIFRVQDERIVEHWDVYQKEIAETVSGNPMFTIPEQSAAG